MGTAGRALLDRLEQRDWFARAGSPPLRPAMFAQSWEHAAGWGSSEVWTNVLIAARNALAATQLTTPLRHNKWNTLAAQIKPRCAALVMNKVGGSPLAAWVGDAALSPGPATAAERQALIDRAVAVPSVPGAGTLVLGNLEWIVLHAVIELEVAGEAGFFRRTADWLLDGHYVCGWQGDLTSGVPIVY
jgi:hypothetical protein